MEEVHHHPEAFPSPLPLALDTLAIAEQFSVWNLFEDLIDPSVVLIKPPSLQLPSLGHVQVRATSSLSFFAPSRRPIRWSRFEEVTFVGFLVLSDEFRFEYFWKDHPNLTLSHDLSMINTEVDPRKPKGSCQRLLKVVANALLTEMGRAKIKVGTERIKTMFEIGLEELRASSGEDKVFVRRLERVSIELV